MTHAKYCTDYSRRIGNVLFYVEQSYYLKKIGTEVIFIRHLFGQNVILTVRELRIVFEI